MPEMWVSLLACLIYTIFTYLNNVDAPLPILLWRKWHGAQRFSNVLPDVIHRSKSLLWSLRRPPFEERKHEAVSTVLGARTSMLSLVWRTKKMSFIFEHAGRKDC